MKNFSMSIRCLLTYLLLLIIGLSSFATVRPVPTRSSTPRYSIVVNKTLNSKKHKVRIYTEEGHENILFTVDGVDGRFYDLFVFDMDGRLVTQVGIKNHETSSLNNISKGSYLFQVLREDEKIESGQLTVK